MKLPEKLENQKQAKQEALDAMTVTKPHHQITVWAQTPLFAASGTQAHLA